MEIRNFVIISHIDHGKSTLADRLLEITGTVDSRHMKAQYLDSLELERERGITIKMAPVRMNYVFNGKPYVLNLIDTPGHSDFGYEVSRALSAVEGAILLVDAASGIQAQTLANFESAQKAGLKIIGAVNKVDMASPEQIESALSELSRLLNVKPEEIFKISGKTGLGVKELLNAVIERVSAPSKHGSATQALIFDSLYDEHKGVIAFVRVFGGSFKPGEDTKLLSNNKQFKIKEVGYFSPALKKEDILNEGETGYIATGLKDPDSVKVGDTIGEKALPGFKTPQPVVFVSLYPEEGDDYDNLKVALNKLRLNDSSFTIFPTTSEALGRGFQAGFLGKLHFEIVVQRLEREFGVKTINSFPSVSYKVMQRQGDWTVIENPKDFPDDYLKVLEPITAIKIIVPLAKLGDVLKLKNSFRFSQMETEINGEKVVISATLPLADLVSDFDDQLKSVSSGFASFSYNVVDYREAQVRRLDIRIANGIAHGLSRIIPEKDVESISRKMVEKLKELLPKKQFTQAIQAMVGGRIIARETITALKKDVAGYLYGGDRSRKMKLWKKQKRGKKKLLKMAEGVEIPVKIFKDLLK
ncbi:MAG: translation elongation factor 4 [Candidatus Paceibacterota bacterium]